MGLGLRPTTRRRSSAAAAGARAGVPSCQRSGGQGTFGLGSNSAFQRSSFTGVGGVTVHNTATMAQAQTTQGAIQNDDGGPRPGQSIIEVVLPTYIMKPEETEM